MLGRAGCRVAFIGIPRGGIDGRRSWWQACWAARLLCDTRDQSYVLGSERPGEASAAGNAARYGLRLQQLIPTAVLDAVALGLETELVTEPWVAGAPAKLAFVHEHGRSFHILSRPDLAELPFGRSNLVEYARLALFYDAYAFRPTTTERLPGGKVRWYATRDGQAISRASLMPEFDYDASRAHGILVVVGRDTFVVWEPDSSHPVADDPHAFRAGIARALADDAMPIGWHFALGPNQLTYVSEGSRAASRFELADVSLPPARMVRT